MVRVWFSLAVVLALCVTLGCPRPDPRGGGPSPAVPRAPSPHEPGAPTDPQARHHHDDDPPHGPMSAHAGVKVQTEDGQLVVEVAQDGGDEMVTVWTLDAEATRPQGYNVQRVTIRRPHDQRDFELDPVDRDAEGRPHTFKSDDPELSMAVVAGSELEIVIDDQAYTIWIPRHRPH